MAGKYIKVTAMRTVLIVFIFSLSLQAGWVFAQNEKLDSSLELMVELEKMDLVTKKPSGEDPLKLNAKIIWSEDSEQFAVLLKAKLLPSWHIYSYVAEGEAYITSEIKMSPLPQEVLALSEWQKPVSLEDTKTVHIYEGELFFVRYYKGQKASLAGQTIKCGLYYQTCDNNRCFPPNTKMVELKF